MNNALFQFAHPANEPVKEYRPGSPERNALVKELEKQSNEVVEIPIIIGGKEVRTGDMGEVVMPHNHKHVIAKYHKVGEKEVNMAIEAAMKAKKDWENTPWVERASIMAKIGQLLATKYRARINAACMLGQSKNAFQAEIDSACETIDFYRFNNYYAGNLYSEQPSSTPDQLNRVEYRPLEGFIMAVTPFNFTSIASNLNMTPALMGNTTIWKPSGTALLSNYHIMQIAMEAGLPAGVVNFLPGKGSLIGNVALNNPNLAGIHFTGSTATFQGLWKGVGMNINNYRSYPRLVGETGGKDFIFAHSSANPREVACAIVRGAFEYQGQKCSAASRAYVPASMWKEVKDIVGDMLSTIKMGDVTDFTNYVNAVIDEASFDNCKGYIDRAKASADAEIVFGGNCDKSVGYFVEPTVILAKTPKYESMAQEIFGPIITIYVYEDAKYEETLELCDTTSPYALTGAIFVNDLKARQLADLKLKYAAGNFYINDKPTGAVVGCQPFGGSRASGTNDKAGGLWNLIRWTNPRAIKETFVPATEYGYPFLAK
ncbi:MAG: L-glutamate gamma-semialdehyde dehydrogenase [Bacteroidales bacterium]|nr:L-glutamate gamma-semialdehyde dehydrogenase [Bacteroidales bacterium]